MSHKVENLPSYEEVAAFLYTKAGKIYNRTNRGSNAPMDGESGTIDSHGYRVIRLFGVNYKAHRIMWLLHYKVWPKIDIDHINHDRLDNNILNLRETTYHENNKNLTMRNNNTSGITGVRLYARYNKWHAQIASNKKTIHLGYFEDFFEAVCARRSAENKYGFHPNHGR